MPTVILGTDEIRIIAEWYEKNKDRMYEVVGIEVSEFDSKTYIEDVSY